MPYRPPAQTAPSPKKKPPAKKTPPAPPLQSENTLGRKPPPQGRPPSPSGVSAQPSFNGPPIPALQQFGYFGSIHDVNQRVQGIVDAFQSRFQRIPTWGHVFNALVSPIEDFADLYSQVPRSTTEALAQKSLVQHRSENPYEYFVKDSNGNLQWNTPLGELINKPQPEPTVSQLALAKNELEQARSQALGSPQSQQTKFNKLAKAHPWVPTQSGFLPVSDFFGFVKAIKDTQEAGYSGPASEIKVGGMSLSDYQKQIKTGAVIPGGVARFGPVFKAVNSIKQGQQELQKLSPEFFSDLPAGGYMTSDWARRLKQWQSTGDYFRQSTKKLADENGFGDRVDTFVKAWKSKQQALKGNPFAANVIKNIPLNWFALNAVKPGFGGNKLSGLRFAMFGPHRSGWHLITPTGLFTGFTGAAKLGFDVAAGSFQQAEADAAFTTTYTRRVTETAWKPGSTEAEARKDALKQLEADPTILRVLAGGSLPEHPKGKLELANKLSEVVFDIAISHPRVWGVRVNANDVEAIKANTFFQAKAPWAYESLKRGNLGEAVRTLGNTRGAERFAVKVGPLVKEGKLSPDEFEHMLGGLYAHGRVPLADGSFVHGDVLPSLRSYALPTPGPTGQIASEGWAHVRKGMDSFEHGLRASGFVGTDNAANFLSHARTLLSRAAPVGEGRYLFADRTPEDIYNFTVRNFRDVPEVSDSRLLAEKWRDEFITARASDNVRGMVSVQDRLRDLYYKTHPMERRGKPGVETEGPQLLSEAPTYFNFPGRQYKDIDADSKLWDKLSYNLSQVNNAFNWLAARHRQVVVSGSPLPGVSVFPGIPGFGESLAYKHATADTARRMLGGGGPIFGETKQVKEARAFLELHFEENPSDMRFLGAEAAAAKLGEYRWTVRLGNTQTKKFSTGELVGKSRATRRGYFDAAGADLRHLVTDDALNAYAQSSKEDLTPLLRLVQRDPFHRQSWLSSEAYQEQLAALEGRLPKDAPMPPPAPGDETLADKIRALPEGHPAKDLLENGGKGNGSYKASKDEISVLRRQVAQDYAEAIYNRYKGLEEALHRAGTDLNSASAVARGNIGATADKELGKFLEKNGVDYEVRQGLVTTKQFDDVMQRWIGVLMTANKWNRGKMFDHVFHTTFAELHGAGWQTKDAIEASTQIAKRQTVYHMLDFSNMLQVEQNLRWMSYFATKHRLYWTWIAKQFVRTPALASAIKQVSDHLDNGNFYFSLGGHRFFVPAGRLVWVNSQEYPETSPPLQFAYGAYKGWKKGEDPIAAGLGALKATSGNVVGRSDQAVLMWAKLASIELGHPATYAGVTHDMSGRQLQDFNRRYNEYAISYYHEHGSYPSERQAVKHVLLGAALMETQRANMFVPVMPASGRPPAIQKLFETFGKILNPAKKRKFLDAHPELEDYMGLRQDPLLRQHNDQLWAKFQAVQGEYDKAQSTILDQVLTSGEFTAETANQLKHLSTVRSKAIEQLKTEDAAWSGSPGYKKKKGEAGLWTKQLEGDPLATRGIVARMFPELSKKQLETGTIGQTYEDLSKTRELLVKRQKDPAYQSDDSQSAIRTLLGDINQKIAVFYGTSKDPLPAAESQYYDKHVSPYIQARQDKLNAVNAQKKPQSGGLVLNPKTGQYEYSPSLDRLETEFRAWRDAHDHPVVITIKGKDVKFPSPVKMGWLRMPPAMRKQALASLAGDSYEHIADYEKHLLGFKTVKGESDGWVAYTKLLDLYGREAALQGQSITKEQRQYIAKLVQHGVEGYSKPHADFMKAYRFAQRPKYQRVEQTNIIKDSHYSGEWKEVFKTSDYFWRGIQKGSPQRQTQAVYREYVNGPQFQSWLNTTPVGFRRELSLFGPDFLNTLTS